MQWGFFYISAANAAPLAGIASGVCSVANTFRLQSNSTSETCDRILANEVIIQSGPMIAIIIGIFGLVAVLIGIVQMTKPRFLYDYDSR